MILNKLNIFLIVVFITSCQIKGEKKDFLINEKDLIPEGIAVDKRTNIIYLSSTYKRKIIQINPDGKVSDFIPQEEDNLWSVLGMEVDETNGILWANTGMALS